MGKIVYIEPDVLSGRDKGVIKEVLDTLSRIEFNSLKCIEYLDKVDMEGMDSEDLIDYTEYLCDMEEYVDKVDEIVLKISSDVNGFNKPFKKAMRYYNDGCDLLGMDLCENTVSDCINMKTKFSLAVGNVASAICNLLWKAIYFYNYKEMLEGGSKEADELFKEFTPDSKIEFQPEIKEWLNDQGYSEEDSFREYKNLQDSVLIKFPIVNELEYNNKADFDRFRDLIESTPYSDEIKDSYMDYVLLQDIRCLDANVISIEELYERLQIRCGDEEEEEGYPVDMMDKLVSAYFAVPHEYSFLWKQEAFLMNNENYLDLIIGNRSISPKIKMKCLTSETNLFRR